MFAPMTPLPLRRTVCNSKTLVPAIYCERVLLLGSLTLCLCLNVVRGPGFLVDRIENTGDRTAHVERADEPGSQGFAFFGQTGLLTDAKKAATSVVVRNTLGPFYTHTHTHTPPCIPHATCAYLTILTKLFRGPTLRVHLYFSRVPNFIR